MKHLTLHDKTSAFSAVELLIVVAILGILAASGLIAFRSTMVGARLNQAAEKFYADLQSVRQAAQRNQQSYTMQFDWSKCQYNVPDLNSITNPGQPLIGSFAQFNLSKNDISFSPSSYKTQGIKFNRVGQPPAQITITIEVSGRTRIITLYPSGEIQLAE